MIDSEIFLECYDDSHSPGPLAKTISDLLEAIQATTTLLLLNLSNNFSQKKDCSNEIFKYLLLRVFFADIVWFEKNVRKLC